MLLLQKINQVNVNLAELNLKVQTGLWVELEFLNNLQCIFYLMIFCLVVLFSLSFVYMRLFFRSMSIDPVILMDFFNERNNIFILLMMFRSHNLWELIVWKIVNDMSKIFVTSSKGEKSKRSSKQLTLSVNFGLGIPSPKGWKNGTIWGGELYSAFDLLAMIPSPSSSLWLSDDGKILPAVAPIYFFREYDSENINQWNW